MYLDDTSGNLIIEDEFICKFMKDNGNESFYEMCESVIRLICLTSNFKFSNENNQDVLMQKLKSFKIELLNSIPKLKIETEEIKNLIENNLNDKIIIKTIDDIKSNIQLTKIVEDGMSQNNTNIVGGLKDLKNEIEKVSSRVETLMMNRTTNRFKGEEGEKGIIDILEFKLPVRDGYTISEVKNIPHNLDILIRELGMPDIRIESKAYGKDTGKKVGTAEVIKFEKDLIDIGTHGIFISLYSGIVGKCELEIDLLPTNKFAFYISNNNYDGDSIVEIIKLIYKLDSYTKSHKIEGSVLTPEMLLNIKSYITDFSNKIENVKTSMKNSIRLLNEINMDIIEKTLKSNIIEKAENNNNNNNNNIEEFTCDKCEKVCKNISGLTRHKLYCNGLGMV